MQDISEILKHLFKYLESLKPQDPKLYEYLTLIMKGKYFANNDVLYEIGDVIDRSFYISSGFFTASVYNKNGDKQLVGIYRQGDIVYLPSFASQTKSEVSLEAIAGAYTVWLTYRQMEEVYRLFPGKQEQTKLVLVDSQKKEIQKIQMLNKRGIDKVEEFYTLYPELLEPGVILRDSDISSYLMLAERTLGALRTKLFNSGRLINPAMLRKK